MTASEESQIDPDFVRDFCAGLSKSRTDSTVNIDFYSTFSTIVVIIVKVFENKVTTKVVSVVNVKVHSPLNLVNSSCYVSGMKIYGSCLPPTMR